MSQRRLGCCGILDLNNRKVPSGEGGDMGQLAIASTVISALSSYKRGKQAEADSEYVAAQQEQQAGQERAAAQRKAIEDRRQTRLAQSRLQALAGGGGNDPTVVNLAADIAGEGELRALTSLYQGEERATGLEAAAKSTRIQGKNARDAAYISGISQALQNGSSMYTQYGGGGFSGAATRG